ncbi:MAG: hypothetical protein QF662_01545 [Phycisphaerae bacterium]|nr:hypothetical protein [Phycisphaerae bacterium]
MRTFDQAVELIENYSELVILGDGTGACVAVCPALQGRIMASAPAGPGARTNAWINEKAVARQGADTQFNNYGGEERFWLGPEGGQFSLWFAAGDTFDMEHWRTPAALNEGAFDVKTKTETGITLARHIEVTNYSGTEFSVDVERTVSTVPAGDLGEALGCELPEGVGYVGFESDNRIANAGKEKMTRDKGLLSIWTLGQFVPAEKVVAIIPFITDEAGGRGAVVNDRYFGPVPGERLKEESGCLLFRADGNFRSKLGITPSRARDVLGSIDFDENILTVVRFDLPGSDAYVNSMWEIQDEPFAGDVVNSYNDGPPEPGQPSLGGFYELETSSPAAELAPGETLRHRNRTFHFRGAPAALDGISNAVFGIDLGRVRSLMNL